jgi:hypothetical protein
MADQPRDPSLTKIDQTELPRTSPKDKYTEQLVEQAAPTHPPKSRKKLYLELELLIALILVGGIGYALHLRSPATAPKLTTASPDHNRQKKYLVPFQVAYLKHQN